MRHRNAIASGIELRQILKQVLATAPAGESHIATWSQGERQVAACTIVFAYPADGAPGMRLSYQAGSEPRVETVRFDWLAAPLGGRRAYWRCPGCQRCVRALYLLRAAWRCRICLQLTYRSSNASDRRVSRLLAGGSLAAKLGKLAAGTSISELERTWKVIELMHRRTDREAERWQRRQRCGTSATRARRST